VFYICQYNPFIYLNTLVDFEDKGIHALPLTRTKLSMTKNDKFVIFFLLYSVTTNVGTRFHLFKLQPLAHLRKNKNMAGRPHLIIGADWGRGT